MKAERINNQKDSEILESLKGNKGFCEKMSDVRVLRKEDLLKQIITEVENPNLRACALLNKNLKDKKFINEVYGKEENQLVIRAAKTRLR